MAYFEDLTPHSYSLRRIEDGVLNIGWLAKGHEFDRGVTPEKFRQNLKKICQNAIHLHRGFHVCEFCKPSPGDDCAKGNGQIRICSQNNIWYVAPTMIYHYVIKHNYHPPNEFINAIINPKYIAKDSKNVK